LLYVRRGPLPYVGDLGAWTPTKGHSPRNNFFFGNLIWAQLGPDNFRGTSGNNLRRWEHRSRNFKENPHDAIFLFEVWIFLGGASQTDFVLPAPGQKSCPRMIFRAPRADFNAVEIMSIGHAVPEIQHFIGFEKMSKTVERPSKMTAWEKTSRYFLKIFGQSKVR
jgi:hypothetical protein